MHVPVKLMISPQTRTFSDGICAHPSTCMPTYPVPTMTTPLPGGSGDDEPPCCDFSMYGVSGRGDKCRSKSSGHFTSD